MNSEIQSDLQAARDLLTDNSHNFAVWEIIQGIPFPPQTTREKGN